MRVEGQEDPSRPVATSPTPGTVFNIVSASAEEGTPSLKYFAILEIDFSFPLKDAQLVELNT
ncbi:hypothetical protein E2C01_097453 [Portunus trituberculatus]|uniref:Uncharacterized protein n=1 Tax=Portunus trituberculatus TaxID=210409 RepID=A0A5B7K5R6_PORTR|nr:hypothetical protein [Portunus trituberculatus]